jgi:hypothetical protein
MSCYLKDNLLVHGTIIKEFKSKLYIIWHNNNSNTIFCYKKINDYFKRVQQDDESVEFDAVEYKSLNIDLTTLSEKELDKVIQSGTNEFTFILPKSTNTVTFKLLTHGDEKAIEAEIKGLKKIDPTKTYDITTRMKFIITSIEGKHDLKSIRDFVDNYLLAPDARALREYYAQISPDIDLRYKPQDENYTGEGIDIPISINFFWPDARV